MNNNNCAPFLNKDYLTEDIYFQTRLHTKPFEIEKIESEEPATEKTLVIIGEGKHTFPSRTRSLSSQSPMVVRPRCRARVGSCQYYEARSLFWWSGFSCFWGLCPFLGIVFAFCGVTLHLILFLIYSSFPLSGSYHTLFCALRRGIITRRGDGDGVLPWFLCHSPSYDYPAAWDASHYLLQNYTPFGSGVLLCGILFLLRC